MLHKFCMIIGTCSQKDLSLNLICDFSRSQTMKWNRKLHNTRGVRVFRPQAVEGQSYCEGAFFILYFINKTDFFSLNKKEICIGSSFLPIPVTEKYSRTMFKTLTSGAMCPRSVLETCTPLTV